MSAPASMKAIVCTGPGSASVSTAAVRQPPPSYILVKVHSVALNPTDWKQIAFAGRPDYRHTVGCDYSGTVVSVGEDVDQSFTPGDRVAGFIHGMKHEDPSSGAFAEYAYAKADVQIKIPSNLSFEQAATLGVGVITVGQSLFKTTGLPWPDHPLKQQLPVLIYGGSTATGMLAIQYAKLAGLYVITTCSEKNFEKVKALGADAVFDYKDGEKCVASIRDIAHNSLQYALDCVSIESTAKICTDSLTTISGGKYRALLPVESPRKDVDALLTVAYNQFGEPYTFIDRLITPDESELEFAKKWWSMSAELLAEGKLKPVEPTVRPGGLQGVLEGLEDLKNDLVSGQKLVYRVSETS